MRIGDLRDWHSQMRARQPVRSRLRRLYKVLAKTPASYANVVALTLVSATGILILFLIVAAIAPGDTSRWEGYAAPIALTIGIGVSLAGAMVAIRLAELAVQITDRQAFIDSAHLVRRKREDILNVSRPLAEALDEVIKSSERLRENMIRLVNRTSRSEVNIRRMKDEMPSTLDHRVGLDHILDEAEVWYKEPANFDIFRNYKLSLRRFCDELDTFSQVQLGREAWKWRIAQLQDKGLLPKYVIDHGYPAAQIDVTDLASLSQSITFDDDLDDLLDKVLSTLMPPFVSGKSDPSDNRFTYMQEMLWITHDLFAILNRPIEFAGAGIVRSSESYRPLYGSHQLRSWFEQRDDIDEVELSRSHMQMLSQRMSDYMSEFPTRQSECKVFHIGPLVLQLAGIALLPASGEGSDGVDEYIRSILLRKSDELARDPITFAIEVPSAVSSPRSILSKTTYNHLSQVYLGDWKTSADQQEAVLIPNEDTFVTERLGLGPEEADETA